MRGDAFQLLSRRSKQAYSRAVQFFKLWNSPGLQCQLSSSSHKRCTNRLPVLVIEFKISILQSVSISNNFNLQNDGNFVTQPVRPGFRELEMDFDISSIDESPTAKSLLLGYRCSSIISQPLMILNKEK